MNLPTMNGGALKALRLSQKKSGEEIAALMGMSRNTYLNLEKADVVPISQVRSFMEAMELSNEELWDLLENLQVLKQQEEKERSSELTLDPKKLESYIFSNFQKNLSGKESMISQLEAKNEKLGEQLKDKEFALLLMKTEIDKLCNKVDNLKLEFDNNKRSTESMVTQKAEKIEKDLEQTVQNTLAQYSKEVAGVIKQNESSGLGDFIQKSGLNSLISNPAFGAAIGQMIANAISPTQNQPPNSMNFNGNLGDVNGFSAVPSTENNQEQQMQDEINTNQ